jgi:DNA-directed RNA polymerase specialized sigma24 family protein
MVAGVLYRGRNGPAAFRQQAPLHRQRQGIDDQTALQEVGYRLTLRASVRHTEASSTWLAPPRVPPTPRFTQPTPGASATTLSLHGLLALDGALAKFARKDPRKAELVKLRFFAGLTMPEAAKVLGVSLATAERYWTFARAWLFAELQDSSSKAQANARDRRQEKRPNR